MKYGSTRRVQPKIRHLALLNGCTCAFEEWVYGGRKVPSISWHGSFAFPAKQEQLWLAYIGTCAVLCLIDLKWLWRQSFITLQRSNIFNYLPIYHQIDDFVKFLRFYGMSLFNTNTCNYVIIVSIFMSVCNHLWVFANNTSNFVIFYKRKKERRKERLTGKKTCTIRNVSQSAFEPPHDKTNNMACAPSEDSDQPGHPPSLIRVFAVRMKKYWVLSYPLSAQQRLWSDWADAQADLSLRWAHISLCWVLSWGGSFNVVTKRLMIQQVFTYMPKDDTASFPFPHMQI